VARELERGHQQAAAVTILDFKGCHRRQRPPAGGRIAQLKTALRDGGKPFR